MIAGGAALALEKNRAFPDGGQIGGEPDTAELPGSFGGSQFDRSYQRHPFLGSGAMQLGDLRARTYT